MAPPSAAGVPPRPPNVRLETRYGPLMLELRGEGHLRLHTGYAAEAEPIRVNRVPLFVSATYEKDGQGAWASKRAELTRAQGTGRVPSATREALLSTAEEIVSSWAREHPEELARAERASIERQIVGLREKAQTDGAFLHTTLRELDRLEARLAKMPEGPDPKAEEAAWVQEYDALGAHELGEALGEALEKVDMLRRRVRPMLDRELRQLQVLFLAVDRRLRGELAP